MRTHTHIARPDRPKSAPRRQANHRQSDQASKTRPPSLRRPVHPVVGPAATSTKKQDDEFQNHRGPPAHIFQAMSLRRVFHVCRNNSLQQIRTIQCMDVHSSTIFAEEESQRVLMIAVEYSISLQHSNPGQGSWLQDRCHRGARSVLDFRAGLTWGVRSGANGQLLL